MAEVKLLLNFLFRSGARTNDDDDDAIGSRFREETFRSVRESRGPLASEAENSFLKN